MAYYDLAGPTVHRNDRAKTIIPVMTIAVKITIIYNLNVPFYSVVLSYVLWPVQQYTETTEQKRYQ